MYNIYATKDVVGLSAGAFYSEVPLSIVSVVYNILQGNPFTSFGEGCIILVQNFILVIMLWCYMKPAPASSTVISVLALFAAVTVGSLYTPTEYQYILPLTTMPMMIYSRMAQIISNVKHGTTGQLSLITTFLQLGGSLARVFTTIMEVGWDMALLAVCGLSTALAGILMAQVMISIDCLPQKRVYGCLSCALSSLRRSFITTISRRAARRLRRRRRERRPSNGPVRVKGAPSFAVPALRLLCRLTCIEQCYDSGILGSCLQCSRVQSIQARMRHMRLRRRSSWR
jgi:hypothetical protein